MDEGGAAACSEDSPLSANQDVDQAGEDDESSAASSDVGSVDSTDIPPAAFVVEEADDADPARPILEPAGMPQSVIQDAVISNEVLPPVEQFSENREDLALFAHAAAHGLTEEALADLLKLSICKARYRTPYLMEKFIEASVHVAQRHVDACLNGCLAFTHARKQQTTYDACETARYDANGKPVKQVTYWPLTAWLTQMQGDPVLGPALKKGMMHARREVRKEGASEQKRGIRDWYHGMTFLEAVRAGLFAEDTDIALSLSTDGFEAWRQRGFQGWPIIVTVLNLSPGMRT